MARFLLTIVAAFLSANLAPAQPAPNQPPKNPTTVPSDEKPGARKPDKDASDLVQRTWTVGDQERTALLHIPASAATGATPVVFAFHGHGGNSRQASQSFHIHTLWPEAIVVYMQGLPTPGALTDPDGKKNGWQSREGLQGDRDLKFFDAVLASLKSDYKVDDRRIYAMGHSNGGGFTYLLWKSRADTFAAFAPSGAFVVQPQTLKPKPALHIAGRNDELVKFPMQERTMEAIRKIDGCDEKGETWAPDCTLYPSKTGTPFVTYIYDGTHAYPTKDAPPLIVRFFREQAKPAAAPSKDDAKKAG